jgi:AraC-like DNA-binding protein
MKYIEFQTHPIFKEIIKCYWIVIDENPNEKIETMIPDGTIDFVFNFGCHSSRIFQGNKMTDNQIFIGGFLLNPVQIKFHGKVKVFGIRFYSWAWASLNKESMHKFVNQHVPLEDFFSNKLKYKYDFYFNELSNGNYLSVIQDVETFFYQIITPLSTKQKVLKFCIEQLIQHRGNVSLEILIKKTGYSERYLQQLFTDFRGIHFSYFSRIVRFQHTLNLVEKNNFNSLTELAYHSGFFDQSHLIREFKHFTLLTPKNYISSSPKFYKNLSNPLFYASLYNFS